MSVKTKVIEILEQNRGKSISGEQLAERLDVSRGAVWKAVKNLKEEGYAIEAITNKGYCLLPETDVLSEEGILPLLKKTSNIHSILTYKTVDSTNQLAKKLALQGVSEGTVVLSEEQTAGKGRMGRSFYSPKQAGIYMSIILRPTMDASDAVMTTTATSVAVCRAIRNLTGKKPVIKWVNDIYLDGRKITGILTEAVSNFETGEIEHIIIGIGINFKQKEEFPEEISDRAGTLFHKEEMDITRNQLIAAILNEFMDIYYALPSHTFIKDYKKWSMVLGKEVRFTSDGDWQYGTVENITDHGALKVTLENGNSKILNTGEISLRLVNSEEYF